MPPRLILIDGLPGSGKSTLAAAIGNEFGAKVWTEMDPANPLHVLPLDEMGAAWADSHLKMSAEEFASASLAKLSEALRQVVESTVFESYPFQSSIRVLYQMGTEPEIVKKYWLQTQELYKANDAHLIYLETENPVGLIDRVSAQRGQEWTDYLIMSIDKMPISITSNLKGYLAVQEFITGYSKLLDDLIRSLQIPVTYLAAESNDYGLRTERAILSLL